MNSELILEDKSMLLKLEECLYKLVADMIKGTKKSCEIGKVTNKKRSPTIIPFKEIENSFFIFYPKKSAHYTDKWDGKKKECRILMGKIFERIEGKVYSEKETLTLLPNKKYDPYTKDDFCIAFVRIVE